MTTSPIPARLEPSAAASDPDASSIDARDLCVHYGMTVALAPSTFSIAAGESVALVGSNGSGKTTLLSAIAGLVPATDGELTVSGSVAMLIQTHHHHRWMPLTALEVVTMGRYRQRRLVGRLTRSDRATIAEAADRLEVAALLRRSFGELSGGQRQRVLVAQALAAEPDVLLLDEPVTGLDLPSQLRILEVIAEHAAAGGIAMFSTHHLAEARRAGRVMLLAGCVLADGTPDAVLRPALLAEAFGGRVIRDDGAAIVVDDHHHEHGDLPVAEFVPHHEVHQHHHDHQRDHQSDHQHDHEH